jgi:hypothetical protein
MRRSLTWALGGTVVLSGVALWWPQPSALTEFSARSADLPAPMPEASRTLAGSLPALPSHWPVQPIEPAKRDAFQPVLPPAPPPPPSPVKAQVAPAWVAPPPTAPPVGFRYYGRMTTPDGDQVVFLTNGDKPVKVAVGTELDGGYVVESISPEVIQLVYPPLDKRTTVDIPPARLQ